MAFLQMTSLFSHDKLKATSENWYNSDQESKNQNLARGKYARINRACCTNLYICGMFEPLVYFYHVCYQDASPVEQVVMYKVSVSYEEKDTPESVLV